MRRTRSPVYAHASWMRSSQVSWISHRGAPLALQGPDVVLDVALHAQPADDEPADHRDRESGGHVDERDAGSEQPPQQDQGDLVDHRRADEEGERHAERDPGLHEADEERHGGAGAERRHDAERRRRRGAGQASAAGQCGSDAFGREEAADQRHDRDDAEEQQQDLGHIEQEEGDGLAKVRSPLEPERREGQPVRQWRLGEPRHEPGADRSPEHEPEGHPSPRQGDCRHPRSPPSKRAAAWQAASSRS